MPGKEEHAGGKKGRKEVGGKIGLFDAFWNIEIGNEEEKTRM